MFIQKLSFCLIVSCLLIWSCRPQKEVIEINPNIGKVKTKDSTSTEETCPDLHIVEIKVIERGKKKMIVQYNLKNKGDAAVLLMGKRKAKEDNIGLQAFFSVDKKYNQGDLMVAGVFIEDALLDKNGLLEPGESYLGELEIDLKRKTSFHANFILHVDPVELVRECDETNNYTAITF